MFQRGRCCHHLTGRRAESCQARRSLVIICHIHCLMLLKAVEAIGACLTVAPACVGACAELGAKVNSASRQSLLPRTMYSASPCKAAQLADPDENCSPAMGKGGTETKQAGPRPLSHTFVGRSRQLNGLARTARRANASMKNRTNSCAAQSRCHPHPEPLPRARCAYATPAT